FLWRWRTSEKQSRLVATGDYAPSILSPWRAAEAERKQTGEKWELTKKQWRNISACFVYQCALMHFAHR
ncbi:hypothetical protein, partial [Solemya elarraichensis gill symbiont]|uniref:hypothetical protein n=1 Tax=Solemya elarraichensis gill symbiont TaxID=1918949 RepID=UPI001C2BA62F